VSQPKSGPQQQTLRVRITEFKYPPVHDALVLGKDAPVGYAAIRRAIDLLGVNTFDHIEVQDDVVSDILVRNPIVRRVGQEKLTDFVLRRVKPMMRAEEILHLHLEVEVHVEETDL
jgi:hypothetical protein